MTDARKAQDSQIWNLYTTHKKGIKSVAEKVGLPVETVRKRVIKMRECGGLNRYFERYSPTAKPAIVHPNTFAEIPTTSRSVEELVRAQIDSHKRKLLNHNARRFLEVRVNVDGPIGITHMGDPHVDNPGCNWTKLEADTKLIRSCEGMFAGTVGDFTDNWVGRLMKLYRHSTINQKEAHKLIEWYFATLGKNWLYLVMGNHDHWNSEGGDILEKIRRLADVEAPLEPHDAQLKLSFPNGNIATIRARHRFKGNSEINFLHQQVKAAKAGDRYDIMIEGDRHRSAYLRQGFKGKKDGWGHQEGQGIMCTFIQLGAYKDFDDFAEEVGFEDNNISASMVTIINPYAKDPTGKVIPFDDVELGADVLTFMRKKWQLGKSFKL